jgi:hypothetical protein
MRRKGGKSAFIAGKFINSTVHRMQTSIHSEERISTVHPQSSCPVVAQITTSDGDGHGVNRQATTVASPGW